MLPSKGQPIPETPLSEESANHVYSVLFTSHNKVWILQQLSNSSSLSSPYQLLIGRVFWKIEWLDWYFSWKAFQTCTKKKKKKGKRKKKNVSTASTENQVICSTDTAVIQKERQVAGSVYWFRYFYANSVELFYTNLVILYVHEFAVILLYQQGNGFTGEVADCHIWHRIWFLVFSFGIQVKTLTFVIPVCILAEVLFQAYLFSLDT